MLNESIVASGKSLCNGVIQANYDDIQASTISNQRTSPRVVCPSEELLLFLQTVRLFFPADT